MKRYILAAACAAIAICSVAQGIIIRKTDGTLIDIPSHELDYIEVYSDTPGEAAKDVTFNASNFTLNGCPVKRYDPDSGIMTVQMPYGTDTSALVAEWDIAESSTVEACGIEQQSGVSANDFSMPVKYTVTTDAGESRDYWVAICWSDMPMLYIDTCGAPIDSKESYVEGTTAILANTPFCKVYDMSKIKGRGNTSWSQPKKSYTLKLNKKDTFAGLAKHKTFALVATYSDKTMMRNVIAYEMGRKIFGNMSWNPSTAYCHLIVNGEYLGVYIITESVKIDANRVNIPNLEDCADVADAAQYGFINEFNWRQDEAFNFITDNGMRCSLKDPDGADISEELCQWMKATMEGYEEILYGDDFMSDDPQLNWRSRYDEASFIDWKLAQEVGKTNDAIFYSSCFCYYDPADAKIHMGPLWDFDISYGNINYNGCDDYTGFRITTRYYSQMLDDPEFVAALKSRWGEVEPQLRDYIDNDIPALAATLAPDMEANFARWDILGKYVWPNPAGYQERTTYQSEVDYLLDWLRNRLDWLDAAIQEL